MASPATSQWNATTDGRATEYVVTATNWNEVQQNLQFLKDTAESIAILQDQKTSSTAGGTFTSGAWRTRDLNTEESDAQNIASISSNQFTPVAGDYLLIAFAPARLVNIHQARLYNATATSEVAAGTSAYADSTVGTVTTSIVQARFTANGTDAYEIQHQCDTTRATNGFGVASSYTTEVYTTVILIKLDD